MKKIIIFGGIGLVAYLLYKNRKKIQTEVKLPDVIKKEADKIILDSGLASSGAKLVDKVVSTTINSYQNEGCVKIGRL